MTQTEVAEGKSFESEQEWCVVASNVSGCISQRLLSVFSMCEYILCILEQNQFITACCCCACVC
jgi:uncharacterized membrane protein